MTLTMQPRLQTQQQLSPRLQQSNQILQLAAPAFQQLLRSHLELNPFLHVVEEDFDIHIDDDTEHPTERLSGSTSFEHLDPLLNIEDTQNLEQYLLSLLATARPTPEMYSLGALVINALDENGYLRRPFSELLPDEIDEPISLQQWEKALHLVQTIAPTGIGARSLNECLSLQVKADHRLVPQTKRILLALIEEGLELLAHNQWDKLKKGLNITESQLQDCVTYLRQLDPKPGRQFCFSHSHNTMPDVYVYKQDQHWHIVPNFRAFPKIKINKNYGELIKKEMGSLTQPLAKEWLDAQWLVESIEKRHHTICEVARLILKKQRLFFEYGEEAIQPLLISDIAAELNLHESTISRATSNKYMSTPSGVFSFKHFFSRDLSMNYGGTCSTRMVKVKIKQYIEQEASDAPLSDVDLHQRLLSEDINIAKRTVTKYRQQLCIPNARDRRQLPMF